MGAPPSLGEASPGTGMGITSTGTLVFDRDAGREVAFCTDHLTEWQKEFPDVFDARLVVIGPYFGSYCHICAQKRGADRG